MKQKWIALCAIALLMAGCAGNRGGSGSGGSRTSGYDTGSGSMGGWQGEREGGENYFEVEGFCKEHGVKFSHGFFYVGRDQKHFTAKWYDAHFETYLYSDPYAHCEDEYGRNA